MSDEIKDQQKKVDLLQKKLALYENDATTRAFYALNKLVNQQVDILNSFDLEVEIKQNPKEDKKYDRVEGIWTKLSAMVINLNTLKVELKITGDEEKDKKKVPFNDRIAENRS